MCADSAKPAAIHSLTVRVGPASTIQGMGSETIGWSMPQVVTLDDLTAMMAADEFHRYEISPEGVLSIMPPPGHALV